MVLKQHSVYIYDETKMHRSSVSHSRMQRTYAVSCHGIGMGKYVESKHSAPLFATDQILNLTIENNEHIYLSKYKIMFPQGDNQCQSCFASKIKYQIAIASLSHRFEYRTHIVRNTCRPVHIFVLYQCCSALRTCGAVWYNFAVKLVLCLRYPLG